LAGDFFVINNIEKASALLMSLSHMKSLRNSLIAVHPTGQSQLTVKLNIFNI